MKIAKIIPCYPFTKFRGCIQNNSPRTYEEWEDGFMLLISNEINIDFKVSIDIFLFYRSELDSDLGRDTIFKYQNVKTKNGRIFVYEYPNDRQWGFNIIPEFIKKYSDGYDYFIYQEDDIIILPEAKGYLKESLDLLKKYKIIAYSVLLSDPYHIPYHIGGTFGMFPVKSIKSGINDFPQIATNHEVDSSQFIFKATNLMSDQDIVSNVTYLKTYCNYPKNRVQSFETPRIRKVINYGKKFLYQLGINRDNSIVDIIPPPPPLPPPPVIVTLGAAELEAMNHQDIEYYLKNKIKNNV